MVRSLNKALVMGEVGRAPEMRYMPDGRAVTSFSVGAARSWEDDRGLLRHETEWFNVVAWGELAEQCKQDLRTDDFVYVEGRLQTRCWQTKDGDRRYRAELVADDMILLQHSEERLAVSSTVTDRQ